MKYIYTMPMCGACLKLKKKYIRDGVKYIERDGKRLTDPPGDIDNIDRDAMMRLSMNNMVFPIEVEDSDV